MRHISHITSQLQRWRLTWCSSEAAVKSSGCNKLTLNTQQQDLILCRTCRKHIETYRCHSLRRGLYQMFHHLLTPSATGQKISTQFLSSSAPWALLHKAFEIYPHGGGWPGRTWEDFARAGIRGYAEGLIPCLFSRSRCPGGVGSSRSNSTAGPARVDHVWSSRGCPLPGTDSSSWLQLVTPEEVETSQDGDTWGSRTPHCTGPRVSTANKQRENLSYWRKQFWISGTVHTELEEIDFPYQE